MTEAKFTDLLKRLEAVTNRLEGMDAPDAGGAAADGGSVPAMVREYDQLLAGELAAYVALAGKLGAPDVDKQAKLVQKAFEAQREMMLVVSKCAKPSAATEVAELCKATGELIGQVQACVDRRSASFNHLQVRVGRPFGAVATPAPCAWPARADPPERTSCCSSGDGRVDPCARLGDG